MSAMNDVLLNGPIPGQSLTAEFGSRPWHKPPQIEDPLEALDYHLDRLEEAKVKKSTLDAIELGIPIKDLTLGILRGGVFQNVHDMDTMFILAPFIHEHLETLAEEADLEFATGFEMTEEAKEAEYQVEALKAKKLLQKRKGGDFQEGTSIEEMPQEEEPEMVEEPEMEKPKGLMSREI